MYVQRLGDECCFLLLFCVFVPVERRDDYRRNDYDGGDGGSYNAPIGGGGYSVGVGDYNEGGRGYGSGPSDYGGGSSRGGRGYGGRSMEEYDDSNGGLGSFVDS